MVFKQYIRDIKTLTVKILGTQKLPSAAGAISKEMTDMLDCTARPSRMKTKEGSDGTLKPRTECSVFVTEVNITGIISS